MKKHGKKGEGRQPSRTRLKPRPPMELGERPVADAGDEGKGKAEENKQPVKPAASRGLASRLPADQRRPRSDAEEIRRQRAERKEWWKEQLAQEDEEDEYADPDEYDDEEDDDEEDDAEDGQNEADSSLPPTVAAEEEVASRPCTPSDADCFDDYAADLQARRSNLQGGRPVGAATGLPSLDQGRGAVEQITVVAGRTQTGKTSLATQFCLAALRADSELAVAYYLMDDMSQFDLFDQMVCAEARVDYVKYTSGSLSQDEQGRADAATLRLRQEVLPRMRTFDQIQRLQGSGLSAERMFPACRQFMVQVGAKRVLVVLDMFNDIPHPKATGAWVEEYLPTVRRIESDPDRWRLEQVLELRRLSGEVSPGGWPILALCQLRKPTSQREEDPTIEDLLGGVELGYKAKRVFVLVPDPKADARKPVVPVTLVAKKARHMQMSRLPLLFHHTQFRFEEADAARGNGGVPTQPAPAGQPRAKRFAGK